MSTWKMFDCNNIVDMLTSLNFSTPEEFKEW